MKSLEEFLLEATEPVSGYRRGQYLMNKLSQVRPDLYEAITSTNGLDCYYNDDLLWTTVSWLSTNWEISFLNDEDA